MRIQVMDEMGLPLGFGQIFLRNALRVVDTFPVFNFVGGVTLFLSPKQQRLGDLAARTVVIRLQDPSWLHTRQIEKGKYNSLLGHARCAAAMRQSVSPEFAALALQCLLRREELEDDARVRLFRSIRDDFQAAASFPEEATFGLSDENCVRSAVELLFASRAGKPS